MQHRTVTPDDIMDIQELAEQIQHECSKVLHGQELDVAVSALMTASINILFSQQTCKRQLINYRNVLLNMFDQIIDKY